MIVSLLPVPALLTRMSAPPNSFSATRTSSAAPSGVATSQAMATTRTADAPAISARAASSRSALRAAMTTWAPSAARPLATASPMPTLPPVITATLSSSPRSIAATPLSFDYRHLRPIDGDGDGADQHRAENDVLRKNIHAEKRHADAHDGNDQCADQRAPDAPDASGYRRSPHHDRGYRRQQEFGRQGRRSTREAPGENDPRQRGKRRREHKGEDLLPAHLHAGGVGGRLPRPYRGAVAAEPRMRLQHMGDRQHDQADDNDVGRAERVAGDPILIGAPRVVQRDGALLGDHQRRAEKDAAHRERGDERGDFQPNVDDPGEQPGERANGDGEQERAIAETRDGQRDDDARQRGHGLNRQIDAAEHDDESDAGREREQHRGVTEEIQQRSGSQKARLSDADNDHERGERRQRQPFAQAVGSRGQRSLHLRVTRIAAESFSPALAGEGGAKRRMRVFLQCVASVALPHPNPLPQERERGLFRSRRTSDHVSDEVDLPRLAARVGFDAMRDRAIAHDDHAVAEADRLLQGVGGQDDREALGGDGADELVDFLLGADVEAARRVIEDENPGLGLEPFRQHDFLLIATGEVEAERGYVWRANFQPVDPTLRPSPFLARVDQAPTRHAGEGRQGDVRRNGQEQHETFDAPFARDVADAEIDRFGRRRQPRLAVGDREPAAVMRSKARERARQLLAARADDAGDPEDFPGAKLETDVSVGLAERKPLDLQQHPRLERLLRGLAIIVGLQRPADHQLM